MPHYSAPQIVYFIKPVGMDGPIKIGCSSRPADRLDSLAVWSPIPLEVIGTAPGSYKEERFLHECFAHQHSHREWFHATTPLTSAIARIIAAQSVYSIRDDFKPTGSIRKKRKPAWTPERRRCISYAARVRCAEKKLRDRDAWRAPDMVHRTLSLWQGEKQAPTASELAAIERFLADPQRHAVIPYWHRKAPTPEAEAVQG